MCVGVCLCVTTFRFISYQRFTLFSPARNANSIPCQLLTPQLSWVESQGGTHTHTHHTRVNYDSSLLFYFPVRHSSYISWTHTLTLTHLYKHLWELCQTEVNLRLALSALASKAHFFFSSLCTAKKFTITVIVSCLTCVCRCKFVWVFHRAHFAALKFYNVARFRKSKQISADIKQLKCVFWLEIDSATALDEI